MTIGRRARITIGYAVGTIALVIACTYAGLLMFDRWVDAPRQSTLRTSVVQSQRNGENLCEFAVATATALSALAQSESLNAEQVEALSTMVEVANNCQGNSDGTTPP